jgi:D-alanyl-D-alanine dipeptidase
MIAYSREVMVMTAPLAWILLALSAAADAPPIPPPSRQLVLVTTPDEMSTTGTLWRFERDSAESPWKPVGTSSSIVVGRTGLASGVGLQREPVPGLPLKKEGDGKSPAGVFALTSAFGFGPAAAGIRLPYLPLTEAIECVDDPGSHYYNQVVDRGKVSTPDWKSSEKMRSIEAYVWGVVVSHNASPVAPGAGSCIFLHAWSGPESPTVGCTAMPEEEIRNLVQWLDPAAQPVLVQLTEEAYKRESGPWRLPAR